MRIDVREPRALAVQDSHDVQRRGFANVVDIAFVGDACDEDVRSVQTLILHVQCIGDLVHNGVRHGRIHVAGELDESRLESVLLGFP